MKIYVLCWGISADDDPSAMVNRKYYSTKEKAEAQKALLIDEIGKYKEDDEELYEIAIYPWGEAICIVEEELN